MGKLKPALGSFHIKHRNIILKPTTNSNGTQVGVNTRSCKFNLNLCHVLKGNTAAFVFLNFSSISLVVIIKTKGFFHFYLFYLIPFVVQITQFYFLACELTQC